MLKRKQQCEEQLGKDYGNASYILPLQQKVLGAPLQNKVESGTANALIRISMSLQIQTAYCLPLLVILLSNLKIACVPLRSVALLYDEEVCELVNYFLRL